MLFELLPLMDAWEYHILDVDDETIPAGGTYNLVFEEKKLGWILSAALGVRGPNAEETEISVRVDDWRLDTTFERLMQAGLIQRGVMTPYIARYDPVLDIYEALFEFAYPIPYKKFLHITINRPSQNAIVIDGEVATIRIKPDPQSFRDMFEKSLKEVLGTAKGKR